MPALTSACSLNCKLTVLCLRSRVPPLGLTRAIISSTTSSSEALEKRKKNHHAQKRTLNRFLLHAVNIVITLATMTCNILTQHSPWRRRIMDRARFLNLCTSYANLSKKAYGSINFASIQGIWFNMFCIHTKGAKQQCDQPQNSPLSSKCPAALSSLPAPSIPMSTCHQWFCPGPSAHIYFYWYWLHSVSLSPDLLYWYWLHSVSLSLDLFLLVLITILHSVSLSLDLFLVVLITFCVPQPWSISIDIDYNFTFFVLSLDLFLLILITFCVPQPWSISIDIDHILCPSALIYFYWYWLQSASLSLCQLTHSSVMGKNCFCPVVVNSSSNDIHWHTYQTCPLYFSYKTLFLNLWTVCVSDLLARS